MVLAILVTSCRREIPKRGTLAVLALLLVLSGMLWARPIEIHAKASLLLVRAQHHCG